MGSIASIALMDAQIAAMIKPVRHVLMGMVSLRTFCVLSALEQHTAMKGNALRSHTARQERLASPLPHAQSVILDMAPQTAHRVLGTLTVMGTPLATRLTTAIQR